MAKGEENDFSNVPLLSRTHRFSNENSMRGKDKFTRGTPISISAAGHTPEGDEWKRLPPLGTIKAGRNGRRSIKQRSKQERLLRQNGKYNVGIEHAKQLKWYSDIWSSLVEMDLILVLILFFLSYIVTWVFFAVLYWVIAYAHGDFKEENYTDPNFPSCFKNWDPPTFSSAYLFSLEAQSTIGFGLRVISSTCETAVVAFTFQTLLGSLQNAFVLALIVARLQKPTKRTDSIRFSKKAVIFSRDRHLHLIFRVGNIRKSLMHGTSIQAQLIHHRKTYEGELLPFFQHPLHLQIDATSEGSFLAWPALVSHKIDKHSPLYDLGPEELKDAKFEIVVVLEATSESTGRSIQGRTSYRPNEIAWAMRFTPILGYNVKSAVYIADYKHFDEMEPAEHTPLKSARAIHHDKDAESEGSTSARAYLNPHDKHEVDQLPVLGDTNHRRPSLMHSFKMHLSKDTEDTADKDSATLEDGELNTNAFSRANSDTKQDIKEA